MAEISHLTAALSAVKELLTGARSSAVLRERLEFTIQKLEAATQAEVALREELRQQRERAQQYEQELSRYRAQPELHQHRGALWRREGDGWEPVVYCPRCKTATSCWPDDREQFCCSGCNWWSSFRGIDLHTVMASLPK